MDKRLLTIQDISCVGQCSLTVALPIISACGIETAILPSSVLSNHTGGFKSWTFHDLTDEMLNILEEWKKQDIRFDAFYTGYVTKAQIPNILRIMKEAGNEGALRIVDPVLGDYGKLYAGFDEEFPKVMCELCKGADVILPNMTEASLMLGIEYKDKHTKEEVEDIIRGLYAIGPKNVVLTGVSFEEDKLGVACFDGEKIEYYFTERIKKNMHSTGDCFASALSGALMRDHSLLDASAIAADFVLETIKYTIPDESHWYGVKFEKALPYLIKRLG